ncbi:hypothetical protein JOQ06_009021 [Pogonophryne albipinna]|uniref:Anoctamin transmembrane domain-containing protein n=1 Tax=Pogonophryne albipinna TaxID=1090488 RepID=A0AAD6FT42_9TELE|nr:hypothetical protein JOQ06_009021 [Pogonophryne albipinna]
MSSSPGIWYNLLRGLSKVAVIVNAFVISFTSDFIPRLVYQYMYSLDGTMHGFVNHTLSYFNVSDFQPGTDPLQPMHLGYKVEICRYKDYREPPSSSSQYELSKEFWAVLAARLAFVVVFQRKLQEYRGQQICFVKTASVTSNAQLASYKVAYRIAQSKKPHTIAEKLILPCAIDMVSTLIDEATAQKLKAIPLSDNTIARRIDEISEDMKEQLVEKVKDEHFALQVDETTDSTVC